MSERGSFEAFDTRILDSKHRSKSSRYCTEIKVNISSEDTESLLEKNPSSSTFTAMSFGYDKSLSYHFQVQFVGVKKGKENTALGTGRFLLYIIDVQNDDKHWTIFRRYNSFFSFDLKIKKKGLLGTFDRSLPAQHRPLCMKQKKFIKKRFHKLNIYICKILMDERISQSQYLYNFLGPFQIGDIKPHL